MNIHLLRVYADTSVFGGVFDEEFEEASRVFFNQVRSGRFQLVTSAIVQEELERAPAEVRDFFDEMLELMEIVDVSDEALQLQRAYLDAKVVSQRWSADALHVALATVVECSVIVSWNFRHIVHFEKIPLYPVFRTSQMGFWANPSATWGLDTIHILSTRLLSKIAFFKPSRGAGSRRSAECKYIMRLTRLKGMPALLFTLPGR